MLTVLLSLLVMLLVVAGMAIGVLMGRKPISGSCGGIAALGLDTECEICGGDRAKCDRNGEQAREAQQANFYDASK